MKNLEYKILIFFLSFTLQASLVHAEEIAPGLSSALVILLSEEAPVCNNGNSEFYIALKELYGNETRAMLLNFFYDLKKNFDVSPMSQVPEAIPKGLYRNGASAEQRRDFCSHIDKIKPIMESQINLAAQRFSRKGQDWIYKVLKDSFLYKTVSITNQTLKSLKENYCDERCFDSLILKPETCDGQDSQNHARITAVNLGGRNYKEAIRNHYNCILRLMWVEVQRSTQRKMLERSCY